MNITTKILKATANERRIKILLFLMRDSDIPVGELAEKLGISFAATSKHLGRLEAVDLVRKKQKGLKILYSLNYDKHKKFNNAFMDFLQKVRFNI